MIIKKDSWHFKMVNYILPSDGRSFTRFGTTLCEYVKSVMCCLLLASLATITAALVTYILLAAPIITAVTGTMAVGVEISVMGWLLIGFAAGLKFLFWAIERIVDMIMSIERKPAKREEPGVFSAYLKARKEKFCPIVKVE